MPYIMTLAIYPLDKADKVAQKYLDLLQELPIPNYIKRIVPAASRATENGLKVINVDEVKKDKVGDALEYASKFMLGFREIEGFNCEITTYATISESLGYIGMG